MSAPESTVFLSDSGDNATGGASTDITVTLERLIAHQVPDAVIAAVWNAEAVDACMAAGVGGEVTLTLGGKVDRHYRPPLNATGTVLKAGYLDAALEAISSRSILMLSPGPTNCDVTQLPYRRVRRPIYPINADARWAPG